MYVIKMQQPNLNILITGASRGIGAAIALQLGQSHNVILLGRDQQALQSTASSIPSTNVNVLQCDVTSQVEIERVCAALDEVDVFVNNAGIAEFADVADMPLASAQRQITTNLLAPMAFLHTLVPMMIQRRKGMIITVNSVAATTVFRGAAAYSASKAGMLAYTRSLRQETREFGVKVIDLIVGATETEIWSEESRTELGQRMMSAQNIADLVRELVGNFGNERMMIEEVTIRPQLGDL